MKKHHHAGLIVRSADPERVRELLEQYSAEFARVFLAFDATDGAADAGMMAINAKVLVEAFTRE
jgi:hypothetical protein